MRWNFEGTNLDDLGIVTLVSDSLKMAKKRGENILIPMRDGRVFVEKFYDQRAMTLGLEIVKDNIEELETAIDAVKLLFGGRGLGTLTQTLENLSVRTIEAELAGDLDTNRTSPGAVKMVLDFIAPDPFFRGVLVENTQVISASPTAYTVNNPGTADERNATIVLTGPLHNTVITNSTTGTSLTYTGTIASPRVVTIWTSAYGEFLAWDDLGNNVIGNITHVGAAALLVFAPGDNALSITDATATTGTVKVTFNAPFI
jgi:hypothetical protein